MFRRSLSSFVFVCLSMTVSFSPRHAKASESETSVSPHLGPNDRPASLLCTSDIPGANIFRETIEIQGLNTARPWLVDMDASTDEVTFDGTVLHLIANNGCDNNYDLVFFAYDLLKMKRGGTSTVRGFMSFFNGNGIEGTAVLTCR